MELLPFDNFFHKDKFSELKKTGYLIDPENLDEYEKKIKNNRSSRLDDNFWKEKRVLITGAAGMVGSTMIDILLEKGAEVYGTVKRHAVAYYPNIQHHIESKKLNTIEVDLRDYGRVASMLKEIEPHVISHQAAESFIPTSIYQPRHVVENNCINTVNILEVATKEDKSLEALQLACSSEQYGFVKDVSELPVKEENELRPTSTYATTKVFTEFIGKSYFYSYRTPAVITRTFNQEGPRRGPQFFTARIAIQIRDCLNNKIDKVIMGNPNSVRDFTHIHDSVRAQLLAIEKCNRGEAYNICSSKGIAIGDYAKLAMKIFAVEDKGIFIDKKLLRHYEKGEVLFDGFIGDNSKFRNKTGWAPKKSVVDIIKDQVNYYSTNQPKHSGV